MRLAFSAGKVYGDYLFFSDNNCNALMKFDLVNKYLEYIGEFPNDPVDSSFLHKDCLCYENKLIFTPNMSEYVSFFSPDTKELKSIKVPRNDDSRFCFCAGIVHNGILYLVPGNINQSMIKVDLETMKISLFEPFYIKLGEQTNKIQSFWKACNYKNILLVPKLNTNMVLVVNLDTDEIIKRELDIDGIDSIYCYEDNIWVCTSNRRVFKWDFESDGLLEYKIHSENSKGTANIVIHNEDTYLVPNYGREILRLDDYKTFQSSMELTINDPAIEARNVHFESYDVWGKTSIVFPRIGGNMVFIKDNKAFEILPQEVINNKYLEKYYRSVNKRMSYSFVREGDPYILNDFINALEY